MDNDQERIDAINMIYKELGGNLNEIRVAREGINYTVVRGKRRTLIKTIDIDDNNKVNIKNALRLLDL